MGMMKEPQIRSLKNSQERRKLLLRLPFLRKTKKKERRLSSSLNQQTKTKKQKSNL